MSTTKKVLSAPRIFIDAFNIIPGTTFVAPEQWPYESPEGCEQYFVATTKLHRSDDETVHVVARPLSYDDEIFSGQRVRAHSFTFDFCDKVSLVGLVVNPNDPDDNNCGWDDEAPRVRAANGKAPLVMPRDHHEVHTDKSGFIDDQAIGLLVNAGYDVDDLDDLGEPISDGLQAELEDALWRSPKLLDHVAKLNELSVALHLGHVRLNLVPGHRATGGLL